MRFFVAASCFSLGCSPVVAAGSTGSIRGTNGSKSNESKLRALQSSPAYSIIVPDTDATDPLLASLTDIPNDAADVGVWGAMEDWPIVAVHAAVLPDGRVLTLGSPLGTGPQDGRTLVFWDPQLGVDDFSRTINPQAEGVDSFCASGSVMTDGRFLVSGGGGGKTGTSQMESAKVDYRNNSGERVEDMKDKRWYSTMIKLPDGRVVSSGGKISIAPEIYSEESGWEMLPGAESNELFGSSEKRWFYPRQWISPIGSVFGLSVEKVMMCLPAVFTLSCFPLFAIPHSVVSSPSFMK